jgi:hypothetical protein
MRRLLIIDLEYPDKTHYHNPETIDSFYWGRSISRHIPFLVNSDGSLEQIKLTNCDISQIKSQIISYFE